MGKSTDVGGGEGGWGEGEREMEVEYPTEDGAGELLLELVPDGCEDAKPVSGNLFRGIVVLVGGGALYGVESGFGDEGWYLDGTRGEVFLGCEGLVIAGMGGDCECKVE